MSLITLQNLSFKSLNKQRKNKKEWEQKKKKKKKRSEIVA